MAVYKLNNIYQLHVFAVLDVVSMWPLTISFP